MTRRGRAILAPFLCFAAFSGAQAQENPYIEKVEVNVRTVLVVFVARDGRCPEGDPTTDDIEVLEDGTPVRVIGMDPVRARQPSGPAEVEALTGKPRPAAASGVAQYLYFSAPLLRLGSAIDVSLALSRNVGTIIQNGPVGIVVADPEPRLRLTATSDAREVRVKLDQIAHESTGRQQLANTRQLVLDDIRSDTTPSNSLLSGRVRSAAFQELQIVRESLERLRAWATRTASGRPRILYFASDGFALDASAAYTEAAVGRAPSVDLLFLAAQLHREFVLEGSRLVAETSEELGALGITVVPLALGRSVPESASDASVGGALVFNSTNGPSSPRLFTSPLEPLRTIANDTGGEVATSERALSQLLARYADSYIVSFQSDHPLDGAAHWLEVVSLRPDRTARGPRKLVEGTPASASSERTVRALGGETPSGDLVLQLKLDGVQKDGKRSSGTLHVTAELERIEEALDVAGSARFRVSIAVEVEGTKQPFVTQEELNVPRTEEGSVWVYDAPISWPKKGRRIAVTVEELRTGGRGTAAVDLPR